MSSRRTRQAHGANALPAMILIETLCALLMGLFTGAALLAVIQITMTARSTTMGPSESDTETRRQVDEMCDQSKRASQQSGSEHDAPGRHLFERDVL